MSRKQVYPLLLFLISLLFCFPVQAQEKLKISLKNGSEREQQTKKQLERLLSTDGFSKWIFTKSIIIDEKTRIPHSHPVLTLNTQYLKDDELFVSTFVHEQIHWFVIQDQKRLGAVLKDVKQVFPKVPAGPPEGARNERSTYLHIPVIYLEYRANRELLGQLKARQVMEYWATHHYRWIYKTVLERARDIGRIMFKHKLVPRRVEKK